MSFILSARPPKQSFGSIIGQGLGQALREKSAAKMQQEALLAQEKSKGRLLEKEYGLKGGVEERKQAEKFKQQFNLMKKLGLDLGLEDGEQTQQVPEDDFSNNSEKISERGFEKPKERPTQKKLIDENKIQAMAMINPAVADKMQKHNDQIREQKRHEENILNKKFESERKYHTEFSKDLEKAATVLRDSIPKKENALNSARNAIETGNLEYFSRDKLADVTGIDLFRTAKGAQLVTAGKENLLSNMGRVSARAQNIWFEQRLNSMFPKIGQSNEANLTIQEMLEGEVALDHAYLNEFDRLSNEDEKNFGYVKKDVDKRARQAIKPLENHIMNRTAHRMKEIEE